MNAVIYHIARNTVYTYGKKEAIEEVWKFYSNTIAAHPQWHIDGYYLDFGQPHRLFYKKRGLQTLLLECKKGKIGMIITRSVAKFSECTTMAIAICHMLRKLPKPVYVYFADEGFHTGEEGADIKLWECEQKEISHKMANKTMLLPIEHNAQAMKDLQNSTLPLSQLIRQHKNGNCEKQLAVKYALVNYESHALKRNPSYYFNYNKLPNTVIINEYTDCIVNPIKEKYQYELKKLLEECKTGIYDVVIAESITLFAESIERTIEIIKELRELSHPVAMFFEKESLFTEGMNCVEIQEKVINAYGYNSDAVMPIQCSNGLDCQQPFAKSDIITRWIHRDRHYYHIVADLIASGDITDKDIIRDTYYGLVDLQTTPGYLVPYEQLGQYIIDNGLISNIGSWKIRETYGTSKDKDIEEFMERDTPYDDECRDITTCFRVLK